jgi:hypothetical protein
MMMICRRGGADMSLAVIQAVARRFCVTPIGMIGRERRAILVDARSIATYIMREHYGMSYPAIGKRLGGRDHTTIINQHERAQRMIADNPALAEYVAGHLAAPRLAPATMVWRAPEPAAPEKPRPYPPQILATLFPAPKPAPQKPRNIDDTESGKRAQNSMADASNAMLARLAEARAA